MIKVVSTLNCEGADVESDPWIEMKISWVPRHHERPLYLRISGTRGGEVELKVNPRTGTLVQAIVLDSPPELRTAAPLPDESDFESNQVPVMDLAPWQDPSAGDQGIKTTPVLFRVADLAFAKFGHRVELQLSEQEVDRYVHAENVWVGVSGDGTLARIIAMTE